METLVDFNPFQTIGKDWMALAMGNKDAMNSMTISWGQCGVLWNKPVFTVYVSSDRFSKKQMDSNKYFTVKERRLYRRFQRTRKSSHQRGLDGVRM